MRLALAAAMLTMTLPLVHAGDAAPRTDRANVTERTTTVKGAVPAERRFPFTRFRIERSRDGTVDCRRARPPVIRGPFGAM